MHNDAPMAGAVLGGLGHQATALRAADHSDAHVSDCAPHLRQPTPRAGLAPMAVGAGARLTAGHAGQALCLILWGDRIDPGDV